MALKKLEAAAQRLSKSWSSSDGLEGTGATPEVPEKLAQSRGTSKDRGPALAPASAKA